MLISSSARIDDRLVLRFDRKGKEEEGKRRKRKGKAKEKERKRKGKGQEKERKRTGKGKEKERIRKGKGFVGCIFSLYDYLPL